MKRILSTSSVKVLHRIKAYIIRLTFQKKKLTHIKDHYFMLHAIKLHLETLDTVRFKLRVKRCYTGPIQANIQSALRV